MTGATLKTLCTNLNGGATIDDTLLTILLNTGKSILEGERDWMKLRKTNTSLSASASSVSAWNSAISISSITDFLRFYGDEPIILFDGVNRIEYYRQVPFDRRLEYKDVNNTFCYDPANSNIYLNGLISFSGTLYINYIKSTIDIDPDSVVELETAGSFAFPSRFQPILAFYAVGIHKGAVDYDEINAKMLPTNTATLLALKNSLENWDTKMQLDSQMMTDPTENSDNGGFRSGAINMNG